MMQTAGPREPGPVPPEPGKTDPARNAARRAGPGRHADTDAASDRTAGARRLSLFLTAPGETWSSTKKNRHVVSEASSKAAIHAPTALAFPLRCTPAR